MVNKNEFQNPYWSVENPYGLTRKRLKNLDAGTQIEVMVIWFGKNYEDPAERTPYESREGGYQWIWGGPYNASEELEGEFGDIVDFEVIEKAVEEVEKDGLLDWAPAPKPSDYEDYDSGIEAGEVVDGDDGWPPVVAIQEEEINEPTARADLVRRLDQLDGLIKPLTSQPAAIGHNNPPEPIEMFAVSHDEWLGLKNTVESIRKATRAPQPNMEIVDQEISRIRVLAKKLTTWMGKRAEKGLDAFITTVARAGAVAVIVKGDEIIVALESAINAAQTWLTSFPPPF